MENIFIEMYTRTANPDLDVLADAGRRLILTLVQQEGELCVCEFVAALAEAQPKVSRQLAILREAGWLTSRREGTWVHYRLAPLPAWAETIVGGLVAGGVPLDVQQQARMRLQQFACRPVGEPVHAGAVR